MRQTFAFATLLSFVAATAWAQQAATKPQGTTQPAPRAQESEKTTMKTTTTSTMDNKCNWDLLNGLWGIDDTSTVPAGEVDIRVNFRWVPEPAADNDDDFIVTPSVFFGLNDTIQLSASLQTWLGDAGNRGSAPDGNYDTFLGAVWRLWEQEGYWPSFALSPNVRIPTGDGSSGVDTGLTFIFTNQYDSGLRSHLNGDIKSVNGTNDGPNARDFQWGLAAGVDGPITDDLRWVADYVNRSSPFTGGGQSTNYNGVDVGLEWRVAEGHTVGLAGAISLDHDVNDVADYSLGFTWAWAVVK